MGPVKYRGIGWNSVGSVNAAPTAPSNGSGGEGALLAGAGGGLSVAPARGEITDALAGRITLGVINLTILAMVGFYVYTRTVQNGS